MAPRAFITGLAGLTLTSDERSFLREARPWGLILFKRNVQDRNQVTELVREALHEIGRDAPVLVDQEGGRVQRLGPPLWPAYPPGAAYGRIYDRDRAAGLAAGSIFTFSLTLGDYIAVGIVGGKTQLLANVIYGQLVTANNQPLAAALSTVPLVAIVMYLLLMRRTGALENV